jgi:hypothetical protein
LTQSQKQAIGLSLAPVATAAAFQANYVLATTHCAPDSKIWMHTVFAAAILLGLIGCHSAWDSWRNAELEGARRAAFLGATGVSFSLLMVCLTSVQWVPVFWFETCGH